jgi:hypothetical protein
MCRGRVLGDRWCAAGVSQGRSPRQRPPGSAIICRACLRGKPWPVRRPNQSSIIMSGAALRSRSGMMAWMEGARIQTKVARHRKIYLLTSPFYEVLIHSEPRIGITICSIKKKFFSLVFFRVLKRAVLSRVRPGEGVHE